MLTKQPYNKDEIVSFKMSNGDEIVAKLVEETEANFVVSKPTTVMPSQQGIGLIQSLFTAKMDNEIVLSKSHVMFHSLTVDDIKNHYIQTTTGIQPVQTGGIVV